MEPTRALRILVVDDNPINQRLVRAILQPRGHTLASAADGGEALAAVERESFHVILMDVQMREMDGFEATARIRANEQANGSHVPIVGMTAEARAGDRDRCLAAGMDGYLAKPFRYEDLIEVVEALAGAPRAVHPPRARWRNGELRHLAPQFVADASRLLAEMWGAVARCDGDTLKRAAHSLRGSAGYFMAGHILGLAQRLEDLGAAGDFTAEARELCAQLADELARLERVLAEERGDSA